MRGVIVASLVLSLLAFPPADAQGPASTLYLTSELGAAVPAGGAGTKVFLFSEAAPEAGKAYAAFGQGATTYTNQFDYTAPVAFTLQGPLTASLKLGCDVAAVFKPGVDPQSATARMIVLRGTTIVGQDDFFANPPITCTSSSTVSMPFELDVTGQEFAAGEKLSVQFLLWWTQPDEGAAKNGYFHVGPEGSTVSVAGLPTGGLPAPPPAVEYGNLTGPEVDLALSFPDPTNATYLYNWTTDHTRVDVNMTGDIAQGGANITIVDGANMTLFSGPFAPNTTETYQGGTGNWTITIALASFAGNLSLQISAAQAEPVPSPSPSGNETDDGNATKKKDKGSPGLTLPVVLAVLVAALAVIRRRD